MLLQEFHLSQGTKKVTYVWADNTSQRLRNTAAEPEQASDLISVQPDRIPAYSDSPASRQLSAASSPERQSPRRKKADSKVQCKENLHTPPAKQGWLSRGDKAGKAVTVQLSVDGLSEETISRMLAVHARTQRRAESLIDKVQALRTGCRGLLDTMPQHILAEV